LVEAGNRDYLDAEIDPDAMNFLLFTSGTTQQSKAVMLSHRNLMSCNYGMNCEEYFTPDDVNMMILPLHHVYGFSGMLTFLSQGMKNVFCDGLKYITINMKEYKVSVIMSVPLLLENMYKKIYQAIEAQGAEGKIKFALKTCDVAEKFGLNIRRRMFKEIIDQLGGHMRFIINGAAALDPVVAKGLNDFGILTVQGYGLTETAPTISSETYRYLKPGSCGKVMPNVEAKIDDPDAEGIGELIIKGDNIMIGYYDNQEATDEVIVDGWFHTGDYAYIDDEGYVFISGRKKNVIVMKNGKNVFPEEIENLINLLPYVDESMVFTRDKINDVVLWAKVVYNESYLKENNMTIEELNEKFDKDMEEINASMPAYKMVKKYFLSKIPTIKTTTLKTKRKDEMVQITKELELLGLM
jgi:Long-chain acyl-CoA synthetases (AMP-forming)